MVLHILIKFLPFSSHFIDLFPTSHSVHLRQIYSITRAFLIEEATIVKRVLKSKAVGGKK